MLECCGGIFLTNDFSEIEFVSYFHHLYSLQGLTYILSLTPYWCAWMASSLIEKLNMGCCTQETTEIDTKMNHLKVRFFKIQ